MKQLYTSENRIYIFHLKNVLEAQGIDCMIKNDGLSSLAGEIPMTTVWPELWVKDVTNEKRAKVIIAECKNEISEGESWVCKNCGEEHGPQFKDCWNCNI